MRYKIFPLFVIVLVCAFSATAQTVVESESSVVLGDKTANVSLVVEEQKTTDTRVELALWDTDGNVRAKTEATEKLLRGKHSYTFAIPIDDRTRSTNSDIAWYRLWYRVGTASGIVSMSQLVHDLFELRIIASDNLLAGMTYRVRVRAINPFTGLAVSGIKINTAIDLDLKGDDDKKLHLSGDGETDADGFGVTDFTIPPETQLDGDGTIKVAGSKNGVLRDAEEDLNTAFNDLQLLMMTDKPIYQSEQVINVRGILFKGGEGKTVVSGSEVEFRITDEDDTVLYRETVRSSEFGIVSAGWKIPANAKLGDYQIQVRDGDDPIGGKRIKISRYDLPNFVVNAKPSKPYYLPGENQAEVEVRADYLFGKPVNKGKVRVVEETHREWNWKEQKYDIDEGQVREGETNAEGKFTTNFDLKEKHKDLAGENWRKYEDFHFAAYFTDLTTNRTEQRRFDIRVTREPIHVYFIGQDGLNGKLPIKAYVSTFYADGTPAECDVEVKASEDDEDKFKTYSRTKTNSFGAGRITMPRPEIGDPDDDLDFKIIARDKKGNTGTWTDDLSFDDDGVIQITTDHAIYKPGETVTVAIRSTIDDGPVYVDVVNGWSVIDSRWTTLKNGRAEVRIPYKEAFKGELKIAAFAEDPDDDEKAVNTSRGIIFPAKQAIKVDANFDKAIYKPNDEAIINFGIVDQTGQRLETALGIVVLDKAVEERARTDADFGGIWRDYSGWLGYGNSFGGVNVKDLNELDLRKPISAEMQLVAEVMLHDDYYDPNIFRSKSYYKEASAVFAEPIRKQFSEVDKALKEAYDQKPYLHATSDAELDGILSAYKIDLARFRDPWGTPYKASFSIVKTKDMISLQSAGPDKHFGTQDDFAAYSSGFEYFTPTGRAIDNAVEDYHERTGRFIRDEMTLLSELKMKALLDRFGRPYKVLFDGEGRFLMIRLQSSGPDGKFEDYDWRGDDFTVWTNKVDYFADVDKKIGESQAPLKQAPMNEAEFRSSLGSVGINFDDLRDAWNKPLYVTVQQRSRYWDKVTVENVQKFGDSKPTERRVITPVTQQVIEFTIRSNGRDGKQGTYDDVTLTQVVHVLSEQRKDNPKPVPVTKPIVFHPDSTGSIAGKVTDANGAGVPNATVTATGASTGLSRAARTSDSGDYLIAGLNPENYSIKVTANGFKDSIMENIPVKASATAQANIVLEAGSVSEMVTVTSTADETQTTNASATTIEERQIMSLPVNGRMVSNLLLLRPGAVKVVTKSGTSDDDRSTEQNSTPRLREYFPETLLWQPNLVTDANGKAQLKFRMADNITTWKMYTIASTKNGKVGVAEKEVTAFQPFFVDLDPPKFLTEGDEIYLPTQVRNYTDKAQKVDVSMDKADWFSMLSAYKQQVNVAAGDSQNAVFGFKSTTPVKDGKQRVTAIAQTDSDAIEKSVTVRPNGQEIVHTDSNLFTGDEKIPLSFPSNALPKTEKAELKIYPNLYAQISDSVEGLLKRPYGCGEQTISSTYPNLMILKFVKPDSALAGKAKKYLQKGYERLLGYQVADGGFSYWGGKDTADIGLTAYALRFLTDASSQIDVDQEVIKKAQAWLLKQQRADGGWTQRYRWENHDDPGRAKITTTYVARSLSMLQKLRAATQSNSDADQALKKALAYLKSLNAEIDEPYALALFGLASIDAGDDATAAAVAKTLESMAIGEGSAVYWKLETNTPFYGWGTAGRVETTALVTQLLLRVSRKDPSEQRHDLINKAILFLLKNKDRYGVWYSTQTTINVLDAFLATLGTEKQAGPQKLDVIVNGEVFKTLDVAPDQVEATSLDLTGKVNSNGNNIEIRSSGSSPVMTQIVASHYIDWKDSTTSDLNVNQSRAIRLDYKCDKRNAAIMQEINCSVSAERIGFKGYGMFLAEIGTPPGADVDRESLEKAIESDWSISHYEVLPDRIIVYMWAKAGGSSFNFKFRPRYAINAQTPASVVYDYYNPEAQGLVTPLRFTVK